MVFTEEQLNGLIVTHAQSGNFAMSKVYQDMLKDLKEGKSTSKVAPYPCRFCGTMVKWKEGQGWKGDNESFRNHCSDAKGHIPFEQYL